MITYETLKSARFNSTFEFLKYLLTRKFEDYWEFLGVVN